jgi:hypothetical protein
MRAPAAPLAAALAAAAAGAQTQLRGRIVDVHGHGVPAAAIALAAGFSPAPAPLGCCDGDGCFVVRVDDDTPWQALEVTAPGKAIARWPVPAHHRAEELQVEIVLEDAAVLAGTVSDASGRPVAGASVLAVHEWWSRPRAGARATGATDAAGRFELAAAPVGHLDVRVLVPGGAIVAATVDVPAAAPLRLVVPGDQPGQRVQILGIPVLGVSGRLPLGIAWSLSARPHWHGERPPGVAIQELELPAAAAPPVAFDGAFVLPSFAGCEVAAAIASPWLLFDDKPGRSSYLAHVRAHCVQQGRVLDADGKPWAGAEMFAFDPEHRWPRVRVRTDADGAFQWCGVFSPYSRVSIAAAPATGRLVVPVGEPASRVGVRGASAVSVALPALLQALPGSGIRGRVVDERGRALAGVEVVLFDGDGNAAAAARTDEVGSYRFRGLGADGSALRLGVADAGRTASSALFAVESAVEFAAPDLIAVPAATIAGSLVDSRAQPVPGWRLLAWPWSDDAGQAVDSPTVVCTDAAGRYTFRLPPGRWRLLPEDSNGDWHWLCEPFTLDAGDYVDFALVLDRD